MQDNGPIDATVNTGNWPPHSGSESPSLNAWYEPWLDRDILPDWLIRLGIRRLVVGRLREEDLGDVAPPYAPAGASLISAAVIEDRGLSGDALASAVVEQVAAWFGPQVRRWRQLRAYRIEHAQPVEITLAFSAPKRSPRIRASLYVCVDHLEMASIQGALISGRRAAEAVLEDLG